MVIGIGTRVIKNALLSEGDIRVQASRLRAKGKFLDAEALETPDLRFLRAVYGPIGRLLNGLIMPSTREDAARVRYLQARMARVFIAPTKLCESPGEAILAINQIVKAYSLHPPFAKSKEVSTQDIKTLRLLELSIATIYGEIYLLEATAEEIAPAHSGAIKSIASGILPFPSGRITWTSPQVTFLERLLGMKDSIKPQALAMISRDYEKLLDKYPEHLKWARIFGGRE
jgi:hypothetical protein